MIPEAAVLIVGDDDRRVRPDFARAHGVDQRLHMALAGQQVGVARVLVVQADGLHERHRGEGTGAQGGEEVLLVLQVRSLCRRAVGVVREVDERLVVELEQRIGMPRECVVPAARIPRVATSCLARP
jgi:hypothetical protein